MANIKLPKACREILKDETLRIEASTIGDLLEKMRLEHPELSVIFNDRGYLKNFIGLFINNESVDPKNLKHPISSEDQVVLLSAVSGG